MIGEIKYLAPRSAEEALAYMSEYGKNLKVYAGGTDLMVQLRENSRKLEGVTHFMDLKHLEELRGISRRDDVIRIGAMTTHAQIAESPLIRECFPILSEASSRVGSPQIRNLGTIGGNVINASPAADTISVLTVLNAKAQILSPDGLREVAFSELYREKGGTALGEEELLIAFLLPVLPGYGQAFTKLGRRKALAISRLNVAVAIKSENGIITDARIAPGCVFRTPGRVPTAEEMLIGKPLPEVSDPREDLSALLSDAACEVAEEVNRRTGIRWSTEYKQPALIAVAKETLAAACMRAQG